MTKICWINTKGSKEKKTTALLLRKETTEFKNDSLKKIQFVCVLLSVQFGMWSSQRKD